MVLALDFVKDGTEVCVKYTDKWHRGIVTSVDAITKDNNGFYCMDCRVKYDADGTTFDETLYNDDFDNKCSADGWTLAHKPAIKIIKQLVKNANNVKELSNELQDLKEQWAYIHDQQVEIKEEQSITITKPPAYTVSVFMLQMFYSIFFVFALSALMLYTCQQKEYSSYLYSLFPQQLQNHKHTNCSVIGHEDVYDVGHSRG